MKQKELTLDILISTIDERLSQVPALLLPERPDVHYIVSIQHTGPLSLVNVPAPLTYRQDVTLAFLQGKGLSRNRNNALRLATGDICLIADDDNRYQSEYFDTIIETWKENPDADIITFQAESYKGELLHPYPVPYVCSQEITLRRESIISGSVFFDERFGLGSQHLCAGEFTEGVAGRIVDGNGEDHQEEIGHGGDAHTERNLARRGDRPALARQRGEKDHDDRGQDDHEQRVHGLPDLSRKGFGLDKVAGWSLKVGGEATKRYRIAYSNGAISVLPVGTVILFR